MAIQTFASFPGGSINAHIANELLMIALKSVVFQQLGEKAVMPSGQGKTFQFNRYNRLPLPQYAITEGVDPASTNMTLTTVQAVADQWGAFVLLSDVAVLTIQHNLVQVAIQLLGYQAAELVDREIINVLLAGSSVSYPGTITSASQLSSTATDIFSDALVQRMVARLRNRGAHNYDSNAYVGVVDPNSEQDLMVAANTALLQTTAYQNVKYFFNGEIGMWRGVRWMRSNFIPVVQGYAAGTYTTPASPAGTFTAANYRISTAYYDAQTGFLVGLTQNSAVAFAASDSLAGTTPNDSSFYYKIFVGLAGGAATDIMYQGVDSVYSTAYIPSNTAFSILAPPTSGASISGGDIPQTDKKVHYGWIFGKQAFCTVDLQNLQVLISSKEVTVDNPLGLRRSIGYKLMFKPVIQNDNFMERFEALSSFD